jgi:hypothetical protein
VSTDEQNLGLQLDALKAEGCEAVFEDQGISGSVAVRPGLAAALERARLEVRNAYLESELKRVEQHHTIALKDNIVLKKQLAERSKRRGRQAGASDSRDVLP